MSAPSNRAPFGANINTSVNTNEPISVIIGKTFESTTLPDGSQQINEVTKYKRLNDGHVYTESKLRNPAEDKENLSQSNSNQLRSTANSFCAGKPSNFGFKLTQLNQLACPSSLTLTSSSETISSDNSNMKTHIPCVCSFDSDNEKGILPCETKETAQMSIVTEDYEEDSMVDEYLYDDEERKSLSPYAAARKDNWGGWCPSFDDLENNSLQLRQGSTWGSEAIFRDSYLMTMFERTIPNRLNQDHDGTITEDNSDERFHLKASRRMTCREMTRTRKCKMLLCFIAFLAAAIGVVTFAFQPNDESEWNINKEAHNEPSCIHLEIIIATDSSTASENNPDGDVNEWSLVRHGKNDHLISIAVSSELSPDTVHHFQHCVQPGLFTFTVSDSGGDGLGTNGDGGYYIVADGVKLGVSSFFFHEDEMTFTLPFVGDEDDGDGETECADDFFLVIKTDDNPEEITWNIVDNDSGDIVMEGGPYELPQSVYTKRACMVDGNYTFNIRDEGEDGICCEDGYGLYMLYNEGELIASSDGQYGSEASTVFLLGGEE
eukprot:scaffold22737_cov80-Cyclotella_meneghiniana.AAC.2